MLQVTPQMRVLVAIEPADFRKGIDGIAQLCRAQLAADPFEGLELDLLLRRSPSFRCQRAQTSQALLG